jgi:putative colanic acid biosynthesis UDP-glucose lipid carrier transferase
MYQGLLKRNASLIGIFSCICDIVVVLFSAGLSYYWRYGNIDYIPTHYYWAAIVGSLIAFILLSSFKVYGSMRGKSLGTIFLRLLAAWLVTTLLLAVFAFFTKTGTEYSRVWLAAWGIIGFLCLLAFRVVLHITLRILRSLGFNQRSVAIIGADAHGEQVVKGIQSAEWTGYHITEIFDLEPSLQGKLIGGVAVRLMPEDLGAYLKQKEVDEVWLAMSLSAEQNIKKILHALRFSTTNIRFIPDLFGLDLLNHSVTDLAGIPAIDLRATPMRGFNRILKAIEDRLLGGIILLMISPVLLVIALIIKLTSKGPVLFKQKRYGWDGKIINVYKFRSMYVHQEHGSVTQATKNDKRITPIGRFIRRTSLDELPQFINVVQGRMSIVGPRPHAVEHNEYYKNLVERYMQRHMVKPGITGWAQINGYRGETDTVEKMEKRIEYDLYYIENWSLWFDFKIIWLTFFKGFLSKNAY